MKFYTELKKNEKEQNHGKRWCFTNSSFGFFMPSEHRSGFGGGVYELFSPQFPSLTSISAKSLSCFLPWLPLLPVKDRIATWALQGYCGFQTWEPLLVWMSHYSFYPQRIKVRGGLVAFHSMTLFGSSLHVSLMMLVLWNFLPESFPIAELTCLLN